MELYELLEHIARTFERLEIPLPDHGFCALS
jgi:hypothetical protein